jgi:hypothetical protein
MFVPCYRNKWADTWLSGIYHGARFPVGAARVERNRGARMGSSDWFELETVSDEIAHSRSRLAAALKTQNHGLVKLLQRELAEAEKWRARLVSHITRQLGSAVSVRHSAQAAPREVQAAEEVQPKEGEGEQQNTEPVALAAETDAVSPDPAPHTDMREGVTAVWDQLSRIDIERLKSELGSRRAEILSRHAQELKDLEAEQAEIDAFAHAIDAFARKFKLAGGDVVVPFEGGRGVA